MKQHEQKGSLLTKVYICERIERNKKTTKKKRINLISEMLPALLVDFFPEYELRTLALENNMIKIKSEENIISLCSCNWNFLVVHK